MAEVPPIGMFMVSQLLRNRLLLSTALAGFALSLTLGDEALAGCVVDGTVMTCSGDLTVDGVGVSMGGIYTTNVGPTVNVLTINIENVDNGTIEPVPTQRGIAISGNSNGIEETISLTNNANIKTSGPGARGIEVEAQNDNIIVNQIGDVETFGENTAGIELETTGDVSLILDGDIETNGPGPSFAASAINIRSGGDVDVEQQGSITTNGLESYGIIVIVDNGGDVEIHSNGAITTDGEDSDGIFVASVGGGDVIIDHIGNITTTSDVGENEDANGIRVDSNGGLIQITHMGDITTDGEDADGIDADSDEDGDIVIVHTGNITTTSSVDAEGMDIELENGAVGNISIMQSGGSVTSHLTGIKARHEGAGDITILKEGDSFVAEDGIAVEHAGTSGTVNIMAMGDITVGTPGLGYSAERDAISVLREQGSNGNVNIATYGTITVNGNGGNEAEGIEADHNANGTIKIDVFGDISALSTGSSSDGIDVDHFGRSDGSFSSDVIVHVGEDSRILADDDGIDIDHYGEGNVNVVVDGDIETIAESGIDIDLEDENGFGNGDIDVTVNGSILANEDGMELVVDGEGDVFVRTTGAVTGGDDGINIDTDDGSASLWIASKITGPEQAIDLTDVDSDNVNGDSRVELQPGYEFDGIVDARNSDDPEGNKLVFGGPSGEAMFDLDEISPDSIEDPGEVFFGFDNEFLKEDQSNFIFTGMNRPDAEYESGRVIGSGLAVLDPNAGLVMAPGATPFTVESGGLGAFGLGGTLHGDVSVWGPGSIVLSNSGPFDPVAGLGGTGDVLTITGNYHSEGGNFYLDTYLNDGSVQDTDKLVVGGDTSGSTTVNVTNTGGPGGDTGRGATDGIKIVEVGGASNGDFSLSGPVYAGVYEYVLNQADGQNWYLQTGNLRDQGVINPYIPYSLKTFGRQVTGTFYERTGTRIGWRPDLLGTSTFGSSADLLTEPFIVEEVVEEASTRFGAWARILGAWSDADGTLAGFNDVSYDETLWAVQAGFDGIVSEGNNGTLVASAFLHYGQIDTDSDNTLTGLSAGSTDTDGWGGGIGLTYATTGGLYLDGVATYTRYDMDVTASTGDTGNTNANGWTVSGEAGWRIAVADQVAVTPQAQLIYQGINIDGYTDSAGLTTSFSDADSLEGRIGTTLEFVPMSGDTTARLYVEGNIVQEFLDDPVATVAGTPLALGFDDTGYEVGLGAEFGQNGGGFAAWVEGDYRAPFNNDGIDTWSATGGVAFRF